MRPLFCHSLVLLFLTASLPIAGCTVFPTAPTDDATEGSFVTAARSGLAVAPPSQGFVASYESDPFVGIVPWEITSYVRASFGADGLSVTSGAGDEYNVSSLNLASLDVSIRSWQGGEWDVHGPAAGTHGSSELCEALNVEFIGPLGRLDPSDTAHVMISSGDKQAIDSLIAWLVQVRTELCV